MVPTLTQGPLLNDRLKLVMHKERVMTIVYYLLFNKHILFTCLGKKLLLLGLQDVVEDNETYGSIRCLGDLQQKKEIKFDSSHPSIMSTVLADGTLYNNFPIITKPEFPGARRQCSSESQLQHSSICTNSVNSLADQ